MTSICAISDLHGYLPDIPECDILLIGGDICPVTNHNIYYQSNWLNNNLRKWLYEIPAKQVIAVAGNHDLIWEQAPGLAPDDLPWEYLQDSSCEVLSWKCYGSPIQPEFGVSWAFNKGPNAIQKHWEAIPDDTQILVLHCPPYGLGDFTVGGEHVGCPFLRERLNQLPDLRLTICGHIHSARGVYHTNKLKVANVSHVDEHYNPVYPPMTFYLEQ